MRLQLKIFFEQVTKAIFAELVEPGRDLLGRKDAFYRDQGGAIKPESRIALQQPRLPT